MDVTTIQSDGDSVNFSLVGTCPHCNRETVCILVTMQPYYETIADPKYPGQEVGRRYAGVTQCLGCKNFVLAVVKRPAHPSPGQPSRALFMYEAHYPMGKPDDSVEDGIPESIRDDFKEALRCMFVNAYSATVCMCGRALEGACVDLKATGATLEDKIDNLEEQRVISMPLKEMAHQIRLTRNRGAHVPKNDQQANEKPTKEHAEALIAFARQFFLTVYTMPYKLKAFVEPTANAASVAASSSTAPR